MKGVRIAAFPSSFRGPSKRAPRWSGVEMFPDLARDDVFRLETARLWLRWPRAADAAAIDRYCSRWEVAQFTARIPHPYPAGSAERFIFAAREGNATGRDLTLVLTPLRDMREAIGAVSLEGRAQGRLTLGYAVAPEHWGKGFATEAVTALVGIAFGALGFSEVWARVEPENTASVKVLTKLGFEHVRTLPDEKNIPLDHYRLIRRSAPATSPRAGRASK